MAEQRVAIAPVSRCQERNGHYYMIRLTQLVRRSGEVCAPCKKAKSACSAYYIKTKGCCNRCQRVGRICVQGTNEYPPRPKATSASLLAYPPAPPFDSPVKPPMQLNWPRATWSRPSTAAGSSIQPTYPTPSFSPSQVLDLQIPGHEQLNSLRLADPAQLLRNVGVWARRGDSDAQYAHHFLARLALKTGASRASGVLAVNKLS